MTADREQRERILAAAKRLTASIERNAEKLGHNNALVLKVVEVENGRALVTMPAGFDAFLREIVELLEPQAVGMPKASAPGEGSRRFKNLEID